MTTGRQSLTFHHVDVFTDRVFAGNPAAVYVLESWPEAARLAAIAAEHNLSETAFVVPGNNGRHQLRWFTSACEVELCGHATLATAHVLLNELGGFAAPLIFATSYAGELGIREHDGVIWMDFPARPATENVADIERLDQALGAKATAWVATVNNLAVFDTAAEVAALEPDMRALAQQSARDDRGVIVTAPADDDTHDFVSRYFAPAYGNDEDPVTGSAHCTLVPYWSARLGRTELFAHQISTRGGELRCRLAGDRVQLGGRAVTFATGTIHLPEEDAP